ncbi:MAG: hypothetical protein QXY76_03355 [Nitrososphaeria archaeon]
MPTGFVTFGTPMRGWSKALALNPIQSVTIYDQNGNPIGAVVRITPGHRRDVERRRHLNALDAGRTVDWSMRPEEYTLRCEGFMLYHPGYQIGGYKTASGSLIDRLLGNNSTANAVFEILAKQAIPFDIVEERIHPGYITWSGRTAQYNGPIIRKYYLDCMLSSWSGEYTIDRAYVAETVEIQVANVEVEVINATSGEHVPLDLSVRSGGVRP